MDNNYRPYTLQLGERGKAIAQTTLNIVRLRKLFWQSLSLGIPFIKVMWYQSGVGYRTYELVNGEYKLTEAAGSLLDEPQEFIRKAV